MNLTVALPTGAVKLYEPSTPVMTGGSECEVPPDVLVTLSVADATGAPPTLSTPVTVTSEKTGTDAGPDAVNSASASSTPASSRQASRCGPPHWVCR